MSCFFGMRTAEKQPAKCRIGYTNSGYYQTDADKCNLSGQSYAELEVDASCRDDNYVLEITEIQEADTPIGGILDCPSVMQTFPNVTFYPPSLDTVSFPTSEEMYTATANGPNPSGSFEYAKRWEITVITEAPCDDIKLLQLYAEATQKRMEFYEQFADEAANAKDLDRLVQEAMDEYFQDKIDSGTIEDAGSPQSAGHFDPCGEAKVNLNVFCGGDQIGYPLCEWLDEGHNAHENSHQRDANADAGDSWTYCNTEGEEEAQITSKWEVNAYGEQLKVFNEILDMLRDLFPECFE